jgi:putative endonuclease
MAGLVPAIHVFFNATMKGGWFYLMTNRRNGILYAGVTSTEAGRAADQKRGHLSRTYVSLQKLSMERPY